MKNLSIPFTKDGLLLSLVKEKHLKYIHDVYMPIPHSIIGSGRPYSLEEAAEYEHHFEEYLKQANELGIKVTLVANKQIIDANKVRSTSVRLCNFLKNINQKYKIHKIVLSNIFIIRQYGQYIRDLGIEVELSVMNNIITVGSFEQMVSVMPVISSVCLGDDMVHDLDGIKYIKETYPNIQLKIIPNHGCLVNCIGAQQHHNYASCTYGDNDGSIANMSHIAELRLVHDICATCRTHIAKVGRKLNEISFIRPEDIELYEPYINLFKLSGRDLLAEEVIAMIEAYGGRDYDGNIFRLLDMNMHVEEISNKRFPQEFGKKRANCNHKCYKCHYCENISEFVKSRTNSENIEV